MMKMLLGMLSALMCMLAARADLAPYSELEVTKVAGKWYMIGLATNAPWFVKHKAEIKMGTVMLVPTVVGDIHISYASRKADDSCWKMTHLAKKTTTPGLFTFHSQVDKNDNDVGFVDGTYDEYALVHIIKTKNGIKEEFIELFCRSPVVSEVLQQNFIELSLKAGIDAVNIDILTPDVECP